MKLNEFVGVNCLDKNIQVDEGIIEDMIVQEQELDTSAFFFVYKQLMSNLSHISSERALTEEWTHHPMFSIASLECKDRWAVKYQETLLLAEQVFSILMKREGRTMERTPKYHVEINKEEANRMNTEICHYSFDSTSDAYEEGAFYLFRVSEHGTFRIAMRQVLSMRVEPIESNDNQMTIK